MKIDVGAAWCHVAEADAQEAAFLRDYLVYEVENARFTPAYKNGWWDGKIKLFYKGDLFPVGLLRNVKKAVTEEGYSVQVTDKRIRPCIPDDTVDISWLRQYQQTGVKHSEELINGILHMVTGSGKTECAIALMMRLPCRWLFTAGDVGLVHQAAKRFVSRAGENVGIIGDGIWQDKERVTFATFQTLDKALDRKSSKRDIAEAFMGQQGGIICDEAHTLGADTFFDTAMKAKNAYWRIGISATPMARGDKKSIYAVGALGPVIYRVRANNLIEAGILAKPKITMVPCRQDCPAKRFGEAYSTLVVDSRERNRLVCEMAMQAERPGLVFVDRKEHGYTLTSSLQKAGLNVEFLQGNNSVLERESLKTKLEKGYVDFVVVTKIWNTGIDIPDLRSVINGAAGKSAISAIQKLGRGSRKPDGKETFEVWDVYDRGNKWLSKHARERYNAFVSEGYEVTITKEGQPWGKDSPQLALVSA